MDYQKDVYVDIKNLDAECLYIPSLIYEYSENVLLYEKKYVASKDNLELVKSNVELSMKENPEKWNIPKATEATIQAAIIVSNEYQSALKSLRKAENDWKTAKSMLDSVRSKENAISRAIKMMQIGFFSGPEIPYTIEQVLTRFNQKQEQAKEIQIDKQIAQNKKRKRVRKC